MKQYDFIKLRDLIHEKFLVYFSVKKRRLNGGDAYYLTSQLPFLPFGLRDFVQENNFSIFHFSDGVVFIEKNMIPKSKLMRLCTLQQRLESIIKDFSQSSSVTYIALNELISIHDSLCKLINYVRSES